ncbi:MAG: preQ(1) synthase [Candidatus Saelkia tenebricola]|nr:preQ(1) synthase [Candidatus Saelkia tenebricola]
MEEKALEAIGVSREPSAIDSSILVTFPYQYPHRRIEVIHECEEFSCLCPFSSLPDFAKITIRYVPDKNCVELKSFKYYLFAYRQVKIFHEHVVNKILEDLVKILDPVEMEIFGEFNIRGGILTKADAKYHKSP